VSRGLVAADVEAVVGSLLAATLGLPPEEALEASAELRLDAEGLALDSLERLELAGAVAAFFGLPETGQEDALLRGRTVGDWTATVLRSWAMGSRRLTFTTSGSTGAAKPCAHAWEDVAQELDALAPLVPGRARVVGLVPRHHIYGFLFGVLLPRWLGVPFRDGRAGPGVAAWRAGDLVVGFPLRWEGLARAGTAIPPGVHGVTSTGPIDPDVVRALRGQGLERMLEVYGSSETGGVGWRDEAGAPYRLLPHWELRGGGEELARAPAVPGGAGRVVAAPDRLEEEGGGFRVRGRRDQVVQVAGVNVSPARVREVLAGHPGVRDCAVRLMAPGEGGRLKAFVVPGNELADPGRARRELRVWLAERLAAPERPGALSFGHELPRDAQGKQADWPAQGG
jgi:4-coumarate--CoA ligase (photoactive yellow protein activation family)